MSSTHAARRIVLKLSWNILVSSYNDEAKAATVYSCVFYIGWWLRSQFRGITVRVYLLRLQVV